jgi:DNA-binding NarL/FixJ family response regulator
MIRVAILDPHPAVRAGLDAMLRADPAFASAGSAAHPRELLPLLYRTDPDVLVVDDRSLTLRVKTEAPRTRVVVYAARPSPELIVAAKLAGADGVVDKSADMGELLCALRAVARGETVLPNITPRGRSRVAARLDARDRAIFAMRLAGTSVRDTAATIGVSVAALNARIEAVVAQLVDPLRAAGARPA